MGTPGDIIIMKSLKIKTKALELYITNVPIYQVAKKLKISQQILSAWVKKGNWRKLKEKNLKKIDENLCDIVIKEQMEITRLAQERLIEQLNNDLLKPTELVSLTKHRLELVRPKQVQNNLNITSKDMTINLIEKSVEEIRDGKPNDNSKTSGDIKST